MSRESSYNSAATELIVLEVDSRTLNKERLVELDSSWSVTSSSFTCQSGELLAFLFKLYLFDIPWP